MLSEWLHKDCKEKREEAESSCVRWRSLFDEAFLRNKELVALNDSLRAQVESLLKDLQAAQGICNAVIKKKRGRPFKEKK